MAYTDKYYRFDPDGRCTYEWSATQINEFASCQRKWAWGYVLGLRKTEAKDDSRNLGTDVHNQLEGFYHGRELDTSTKAGRIASYFIADIPKKSDDVYSESVFRVWGRHLWTGRKDLEEAGKVVDYKTTSSPIWILTPEELREAPQAILYAVDNYAKYRVDPITVEWRYATTRSPYIYRNVTAEMSHDYFMDVFEELEKEADKGIVEVKRALDMEGDELRKHILSLPFDASQCNKYRGCPYKGLCNLTPEQRFSGQMKRSAQDERRRIELVRETEAEAGSGRCAEGPDSAVDGDPGSDE